MSRRFPRRYGKQRIFIIDVTFVPEETCFAMRDEEGRVFIWARKGCEMIQNREYFNTLVDAVLPQEPHKVVTPTMTEGFVGIDEVEAGWYGRSLVRYIERGTAPEEEPMLIVAYGCYGPVTPTLRDALAGVLAPAAV